MRTVGFRVPIIGCSRVGVAQPANVKAASASVVRIVMSLRLEG
jgi:hypothetical protein